MGARHVSRTPKAIAWLAALFWFACAPDARADGPREVGGSKGDETAPRRLRWDARWARFAPWEYAATAASLAGSVAVRLAAPRPVEPNWRGDFLGDFALQKAVALEDSGAREAWEIAGDAPYLASFFYPLVDALFVAGLAHDSGDVAAQMVLIDLEAFAVASPLVWVTQHFVRRERPERSRPCGPLGGHPDGTCGPPDDDNVRSFPGGHVAIVSTTAALTCTHHAHLRLYGRVGDPLACGAAIAAAGLTGASRILTDNHYASDIVVGVGIGVLSGYVVPSALHYGFGGRGPRSRSGRTPGLRVGVAPLASPTHVGLSAFGAL